MASLNSILHTLANVVPFRSEQELHDFRADIDSVSPVETDEPKSSDEPKTEENLKPASGAKK